MAKDFDEWKYISVCNNQSITFDFIIPSRPDCIKFIVALSQAATSVNKRFYGITNHRMISSIFLRLKLRRIANERNLTVA